MERVVIYWAGRGGVGVDMYDANVTWCEGMV